MRRRRSRIREADAKAAVVAMFRRHGHDAFRLPPGPVGDALIEASRRSWVWFPTHQQGMVTVFGRRAVAEYLGPGEEADGAH